MSEFTPDTDSRGLLTPEQAAADAADLQASLADLAALVSGQSGLGGLLGQVAAFAAHAVPGADGAGDGVAAGGPARPAGGGVSRQSPVRVRDR